MDVIFVPGTHFPIPYIANTNMNIVFNASRFHPSRSLPLYTSMPLSSHYMPPSTLWTHLCSAA